MLISLRQLLICHTTSKSSNQNNQQQKQQKQREKSFYSCFHLSSPSSQVNSDNKNQFFSSLPSAVPACVPSSLSAATTASGALLVSDSATTSFNVSHLSSTSPSSSSRSCVSFYSTSFTITSSLVLQIETYIKNKQQERDKKVIHTEETKEEKSDKEEKDQEEREREEEEQKHEIWCPSRCRVGSPIPVKTVATDTAIQSVAVIIPSQACTADLVDQSNWWSRCSCSRRPGSASSLSSSLSLPRRLSLSLSSNLFEASLTLHYINPQLYPYPYPSPRESEQQKREEFKQE